MSIVSTEEVIEMISDLVRIDSVTPWLVAGGAGEAEVTAYFTKWLEGVPVEIEVQEIAPGRMNFLATLRGTGGGPSICLNAHADTVGYAGWPDDALVPKLDGDRLFGLGSGDDKGCCAIALLVLRHLATKAPALRGDVTIALVADEEGVSIGSEHLVKTKKYDFAIVIEADALPKVVVEHQGFGWIDVVVHGKAAHGSTPDQGVDAIVGLSEVITRMHAHDIKNFKITPAPRNGQTVFHTGTIQGGTDYATYPSIATLGIEIGTQPGETLDDRVREIEGILREVEGVLPGMRGEVTVRLNRSPCMSEGAEPLLACLHRAATQHLGHPLEEVGLNAWTDAALMQEVGTPTVMLGPLGGNFHSPYEWVSIPEVVSTVDILATAIEDLLA